MSVDGLVVVDKPTGCTSHDVVARLRRIYGQRRIGHAGTLDPDATGVLLVGLGRATRLLRFLQETTKGYRATIVFGVATDTLDASGAVLDRVTMRLTRAQVEDATRGFLGERDQVPPMVSAIKIGGRRLHELARKGEEVERPSRRVRVDRFDVDGFTDGAYPEADVTVECGSGTYVRSLAADLGVALGGCAHLRDLRRLRVGAFDVSEAHPLETVESDPSAVVLTPAEALRGMARVEVAGEEARAVAHGAVFAPAGLPACTEGGPFAIVDAQGALLAVYERKGAALKAAVVMPEGATP
ncbi:MAG TPA: tRNA pseudouridine(55) synthase TruB [Acidimicrobiia bacterium]|nr:tRNA pseudouridine(55) synthase TruB [Acidimicrobiia bacterium]